MFLFQCGNVVFLSCLKGLRGYGLTFVQKAFLAGPIFGGAYFRRGLLLNEILRFKMGWAYIWEGLLSEGFLRPEIWGAYFREGFFFWTCGFIGVQFFPAQRTITGSSYPQSLPSGSHHLCGIGVVSHCLA